MVFGQSLFQSVVTRLEAERAEDEREQAAADTGASFRIHGLGAGFVASTADEPASIGTGTDAYQAFLTDMDDFAATADPAGESALKDADKTKGEDDGTEAKGENAAAPPAPGPAPATPEPQIPAHLTRLSEPEIAEELSLSEKDDEAALNEKRRRFAKANHPDGTEPQWRDRATIRMKIANLMIDTAIRTREIRIRLNAG